MVLGAIAAACGFKSRRPHHFLQAEGIKYADMAELADALDSGSSDFTVIQVQVLLSAPNESRKYGVGCVFGIFLCV